MYKIILILIINSSIYILADEGKSGDKSLAAGNVKDSQLINLIVNLDRGLLEGKGSNPAGNCADKDSNCAKWAAEGECQANPNYMQYSCKKSCNQCPEKLTQIQKERDPDVYFSDTKNCNEYTILNKQLDYWDGFQECISIKYFPLWIESTEELNFVNKILVEKEFGEFTKFWTGGFAIMESIWKNAEWRDIFFFQTHQLKINQDYWGSGEPSGKGWERCIDLYNPSHYGGFKLNDIDCSEILSHVLCKRKIPFCKN